MMACCRPGEDDGEAEEETAHILPPPLVVVVNPTTDLNKSHKRQKASKKVVVSVIACFSWVSMGGLQGLLGPAIPAIAKHLAVPNTSLGWAFTVRAGGYITGSLLISRFMEDGAQRPSKLMIMACAGLVASVINVAMPHSASMVLLLFLCFLQGNGLSIISTLGNIVLLETWGPKAGPWLQGLHFSFGIGAILSSLILGVSGITVSFNIFACVGMLPLVAVVLVEKLSRWREEEKEGRKNQVIVVEDEEGREDEGEKTRQFYSNSTKDMHFILEGGPTGAGREGEGGVVNHEGKNDKDHLILLPPSLSVPAKEDLSAPPSLPSSSLHQRRSSSSSSGSCSSSSDQVQQHQYQQHMRRLTLTIIPPHETIMALAIHHHQHHSDHEQQQNRRDNDDQYDGGEVMLYSGVDGGISLLERIGRSESTAAGAAGATRATRGESAEWGGGKERGEGEREGEFWEKEGPQEVTIATDLNISRSTAVAAAAAAHHYHQLHQQCQQQCECGAMRSRLDSLSSSTSSSSSSSSSPSTKTLPLPDSIKWLLTLFLGLYVGGECGFGGWISTFVLLEGEPFPFPFTLLLSLSFP
jgi:hypothetical protein